MDKSEVVVKLVVITDEKGFNEGRVVIAKASSEKEEPLYITEKTDKSKEHVLSNLERFCDFRGYVVRQYACAVS